MRLFISYSRDDAAWVSEFWRALRDEAHYDAWIDRSLVPAQDWWGTILDNIEAAECFLYVLSPRAVDSIYCHAELNYALALNKPVLPVMLKDCVYPPELSQRRIQYQIISDYKEMARVLVKVILGLAEVRIELFKGKYAGQKAERPSVPTPEMKKEQAIEIYIMAQEAFEVGNFALAESLFQDVIKADPEILGPAATVLLKKILNKRDSYQPYQNIAKIASNPANLDAARAAWRSYVQKYGEEYDPDGLAITLAEVAAVKSPSPSPMPTPKAKEGDPSKSPDGGSLCQIHLATGSMMQIRNIDVFVNSENDYMQMARMHESDTISAQLRYYGSHLNEVGNILEDSVQQELDMEVAKLARPIGMKQVIVTHAGHPRSELRLKRKIRYIFHVATVHVDWMVQRVSMQPITDEDGMKQCVFNCFEKVLWVNQQQGVISAKDSQQEEEEKGRVADYKPITSIAFPLFGTGRGGRKAIEVAPAMAVAFKEYLSQTPNATLKDIYLCVYREEDVPLVKAQMDKIFRPRK